jgi:hypothetical protein
VNDGPTEDAHPEQDGVSAVDGDEGLVPMEPRACRHLADSQAWLELLHDAADSG